MKCAREFITRAEAKVALFTRAWIEIYSTCISPIVIESPSSRGRGLKFVLYPLDITHQKSPSSRGRGLKYRPYLSYIRRLRVALFTRAWIEIKLYPKDIKSYNVALFTRAWIEIEQTINTGDKVGSPSSRGRGLKYNKIIRFNIFRICRPLHEGVD